ncbi:hypothetical protein ACVWWO_002061 [Bradyrhizobium sp. F1.13.1]
MKHTEARPYARELLELAAGVQPINDRIHIEKINYPFLYTLKGKGTGFGAGIRCAVEKGWRELHESGTYVRLLTAVERAAQSIDQRE